MIFKKEVSNKIGIIDGFIDDLQNDERVINILRKNLEINNLDDKFIREQIYLKEYIPKRTHLYLLKHPIKAIVVARYIENHF